MLLCCFMLYICIINIYTYKYIKIMRTKTYKVSKTRAVEIAMNHNCVSREIAERYTDSELKEVLKQLKLKADF